MWRDVYCELRATKSCLHDYLTCQFADLSFLLSTQNFKIKFIQNLRKQFSQKKIKLYQRKTGMKH